MPAIDWNKTEAGIRWNKEYNKKYRLENKDRIKLTRDKYLKENKDRISEVHNQYVQLNYKQVYEYNKKWRAENKEWINTWNKNNKHKRRIYKLKRRYSEADLSVEVIQLVYENNIKQYGTLTCVLCDKSIEFGKDSLEHLNPLSRGGGNNFENLGVAHQSCNLRKQASTMDEWQQRKHKYAED